MEDNYYSNEGRINRKKFTIRTVIYVIITASLFFSFRKICKLLNIGGLNNSPFRDPLNSPWSLLLVSEIVKTMHFSASRFSF